MHAASALLYLRVTSIRNRIVTRVKRLKRPKYLFGAIVGVVYFYLVFARRFLMRTHLQPLMAGTASTGVLAQYHTTRVTAGALLFTVVALLYWVWPRSRAALTFTEAEIAFLFPAPIKRRTLIHYRIINLMFITLLTALVFLLFSNGAAFLPGNAVMRFTGWWIVLATLGLHSIASSFVITRLFDRGITSRKRQWLVLISVAGIVAVFGAWSWHALPPVPVTSDPGALWDHIINAFNTAPLSWLLLPAKLVIAPVMADNLVAYDVAMAPALLMIALHYYWVLRNEVSFEEASIIKAEKRAAQVAAMRAGKSRLGAAPAAKLAPFRLDAVRRPEIAFLWKNLLSTASYLRAKTLWTAVLVVVMFSLWVSNGQHPELRQMTIVIATTFMCYSLIFGPLIARQDLRSDLNNADTLKTYPLPGWQIVLGEILTPVMISGCIYGLLLLMVSLCMDTAHLRWMTPMIHWSATLAVAITGIQLCIIQVLVLNAAAILFPAWMRIGVQGGPGGIEVMGQRLLFVAGLMLVFVLTLLPAVLFAALIYFFTQWFAGVLIATTLAVLVIIAILIVEIVYGVDWLGDKFEQFDLSAELRS